MENKKLPCTSLLLVIALAIQPTLSNAQMVGANAYLKGNLVEIGLSGLGGFEGAPDTTTIPAGMHFRSNNPYFGFVANPQNDAWTNFDGDYFTPGTPENGWGFEIGLSGTTSQGNNCAAMQQINGAITDWSYLAGYYSADWEGNATSSTDLNFKINYLLGETDLFYVTTVTVTNNTASPISDLYYYRNLDPDNNVTLTGDYVTNNKIEKQSGGCCGDTVLVTARQSLPWSSYFGFTTADSNWRCGYGGFSNRDASNMYQGVGYTQTLGATNTADEAIYLAHRIATLDPGVPQTFKFCSLFGSGALSCALAATSVSQSALASVATDTPPFILTGGSPAGGTYSGTGVVGGTTFDPAISGAGDFTLLYTYTDGGGCTSAAKTSIHVDVAAGISTAELMDVTSVYPNPFTNNTTISVKKSLHLQNAELHIYDVVGKERMKLSGIQSNEITIERKDLNSGIYFYKLINNDLVVGEGKLMVK